ncbi:MAG TPA: IS200/IS605 family transposase [Lachnospiraceae bacterium]|nr:IS200/IS605 family transposase [Lachnospiraceae bacterium]
MDNQILSHSRYNCRYHVGFIPKYRRKVMFGALRLEVGESISKICKMEVITIIKAATLPNHVHMYVLTSPKESVAKVVGRNNCHFFWPGGITVRLSVT